MQHITEGVLQVVAGDIEKLLLEQQEGIAFAYNKISDGIKLTISITMDRTAQGVQVEHALSYPLEARPEPPQKHKVKFKRTIDEGQAAMEFIGKEMREGRMSVSVGGETIGAAK